MTVVGEPRGKTVGSTDRHGDARDTPVSLKVILATAFHVFGIGPRTTVTDPQGRPLPITGGGALRPELLARGNHHAGPIERSIERESTSVTNPASAGDEDQRLKDGSLPLRKVT